MLPLLRRARLRSPLPRAALLCRSHYGHSHSHEHSHGARAGGELRSMMPPLAASSSSSGPRQPLSLGLDTARAVTNLSRALESHAEASVSAFADMFESVWYSGGLLWRRSDDDEEAAQQAGAAWTVASAADELASLRARRALPLARPALLSLSFADERTA